MLISDDRNSEGEGEMRIGDEIGETRRSSAHVEGDKKAEEDAGQEAAAGVAPDGSDQEDENGEEDGDTVGELARVLHDKLAKEQAAISGGTSAAVIPGRREEGEEEGVSRSARGKQSRQGQQSWRGRAAQHREVKCSFDVVSRSSSVWNVASIDKHDGLEKGEQRGLSSRVKGQNEGASAGDVKKVRPGREPEARAASPPHYTAEELKQMKLKKVTEEERSVVGESIKTDRERRDERKNDGGGGGLGREERQGNRVGGGQAKILMLCMHFASLSLIRQLPVRVRMCVCVRA